MRLSLALSLTDDSDFSPLSLFTSSLGAVYDPSDASPLTDKTGNGWNLTASGAGAAPVSNYLSFDGTAYFDIANRGSLLSGWTAGTAIYAVQAGSETPAANRGGLLGFFSGQEENYPLNNGEFVAAFGTNTKQQIADPGTITNWNIIVQRADSSNFRVAFNGTEIYNRGSNTVAFTTGHPSYQRIGDNGYIGTHFIGKMGRMILINRVLEGADLANARAWCLEPYA